MANPLPNFHDEDQRRRHMETCDTILRCMTVYNIPPITCGMSGGNQVVFVGRSPSDLRDDYPGDQSFHARARGSHR